MRTIKAAQICRISARTRGRLKSRKFKSGPLPDFHFCPQYSRFRTTCVRGSHSARQGARSQLRALSAPKSSETRQHRPPLRGGKGASRPARPGCSRRARATTARVRDDGGARGRRWRRAIAARGRSRALPPPASNETCQHKPPRGGGGAARPARPAPFNARDPASRRQACCVLCVYACALTAPIKCAAFERDAGCCGTSVRSAA